MDDLIDENEMELFEDDTWIMELNTALLEGCRSSKIYSICQGRTLPPSLRAEVWQACLDVVNKPNQICHFNEIFDLPNQTRLRDDCRKAVEKLGNDDAEKVSVCSDLESIITFYCKCRKLTYESNNGWMDILMPLLALKLAKSETYNLFEAICDTYVPMSFRKNGSAFHILRLLLLYHDPELCSFFDTKRVTLDMVCLNWFQTLFASTCSLPVILRIWDLYFQQGAPFFIFFLSLAMIQNARDKIIAMKGEAKETFVDVLANMPREMEPGDVADFCDVAKYYAVKTPVSFKIDLLQTLYVKSDEDVQKLSEHLCLPVTAQELVENVSMKVSPDMDMDSVRFFLVDCRPADQYNAGHLPTAFHLDSNLMLQEPSEFATAVQGLLNAQRGALASNSAAGGEHLCFLGSGRQDEDKYTHMVVASFLKKHTQYVSMLVGGYKAIHDYYGDEAVSCLDDHNSQLCLCCREHNQCSEVPSNVNAHASVADDLQPRPLKRSQSIDLFGKISAAMKSKSVEVKDKLIDYIVNPNGASDDTNRKPQQVTHHVSTQQNGKRYRNVAPVFSIDDSPVEDASETVTIPAWWEQGHAGHFVAVFDCLQSLPNNTMVASYMVVTKTELIILRPLEANGKSVKIIARRPLSSIVGISAKRASPQPLTFCYGFMDNQQICHTDKDVFVLKNNRKVTDVIKEQISNLMDNT